MDEVQKIGRQWLKDTNSDLLIWGYIDSEDFDTPVRLRFTGAGKAGLDEDVVYSDELPLPAASNWFGVPTIVLAVVRQASLSKFTRNKTPLLWAYTHMRIGDELFWATAGMPIGKARGRADVGGSFFWLDDPDRGTEILELITTEFETALEIFGRGEWFAIWAATLTDLGTTQLLLGERTGELKHYNDAIASFRTVVEAVPEELRSLFGVEKQVHLGTALLLLGKREAETTRIRAALETYEDAVEASEPIRQSNPWRWALAQIARANALRVLGEREQDFELSRKSISIYRMALKELDKTPWQDYWGLAHLNLAIALTALGKQRGDLRLMRKAGSALRAAIDAFENGNMANLALIARERMRALE